MRAVALVFGVACSTGCVHVGDQVIQGVRVFDGEHTREGLSVLIRDGKLAKIAPSITAPGALVIDGAGRTLMPGLIDAHTHVRSALDLERTLVFGVTTEFSLNMDPALAQTLKPETPQRAALFSAGSAATAPKGHGTEFGWEVPTVAGPEHAQAWVDARLAEGSDFIKLMYEHGGEHGRVGRPSLDPATLAALIQATHARQKLAIVHIHTAEQAREALEAGADGLAHLYLSGADAVTPLVVDEAAKRGAFVIPTLSLLRSVCGERPGAEVLDDPKLRPYLLPDDVALLGRNIAKEPASECPTPAVVTGRLSAAKVAIVAGTDEPKPGVVTGASLHTELAALVAAGLSPTEALTAATSQAARAFRLADRGRVAEGLRADLLLVEGNPTVDLMATRNIVGVWKAGVRFDREAWRARASAPP